MKLAIILIALLAASVLTISTQNIAWVSAKPKHNDPGGDCKKGNMTTTCPPSPPPKLPKECHAVGNNTLCIIHHIRTVTHNTVQQVPVTTNDINLFIVTSCTNDANDGTLKGELATLCDTSITMMHNEGLDAQLPQVDMYLKARGLLT